jgi:hypothetical protein
MWQPLRSLAMVNMHRGKHGKEKEARLKNNLIFCLYRTRIGRSAIEKSASTLAVGC